MTKSAVRILFLSVLLSFVIGLAANHFYRDVRPQRVSIRVDIPPPPTPPTPPRSPRPV